MNKIQEEQKLYDAATANLPNVKPLFFLGLIVGVIIGTAVLINWSNGPYPEPSYRGGLTSTDLRGIIRACGSLCE